MSRYLSSLIMLWLCASLHAEEINVYAASSLTEALKEIGVAFEKQSSGDHVSYNFAASSTLSRQIEEGAPADIFFSADEAQMNKMQESGRIDNDTRRDLLSNTLVVIAPSDSKLTINAIDDLKKVQHIAVGDPKFVPVGVYTRGYLEKAGMWKDLESKIVPTENVRAGMAVVESGNAEVGFVYKTDAGVSKKVKIIFNVPPTQAPPIIYPVAAIKLAPHTEAAQKFLNYLNTESAFKVFEKFGFIVKH